MSLLEKVNIGAMLNKEQLSFCGQPAGLSWCNEGINIETPPPHLFE